MPPGDHARIRFWRPDSPSVAGMLRIEREDRIRTSYAERFLVAVIYDGAFDGWHRGGVRTHAAGDVKLKQPGEVHRAVRVHAPFTMQGALFTPAMVAAAGDALGLGGGARFPSDRRPGEHATRLAFAMHAALVRADATELETATLVAETLGEILRDGARGAAPAGDRAMRAVRRARGFLHDALAERVTLDDLASHAGLDKFHLVRAFRAELGLPPYEYLTHARVSRAKELLQRGLRVADAAQAVGFCDESQLHRHFRRIVGITPGRFARSFTGVAPRRQHRPIRARATVARSPHDIIDSQ